MLASGEAGREIMEDRRWRSDHRNQIRAGM
jgi:hypothetical protein